MQLSTKSNQRNNTKNNKNRNEIQFNAKELERNTQQTLHEELANFCPTTNRLWNTQRNDIQALTMQFGW